jgi:hypothetical protein
VYYPEINYLFDLFSGQVEPKNKVDKNLPYRLKAGYSGPIKWAAFLGEVRISSR